MDGISLLLGDGFVMLPIEETLIWAVFYAALFWLPVRGVAAVLERGSRAQMRYSCQPRTKQRSARGRPAYHMGMKILPPF